MKTTPSWICPKICRSTVSCLSSTILFACLMVIEKTKFAKSVFSSSSYFSLNERKTVSGSKMQNFPFDSFMSLSHALSLTLNSILFDRATLKKPDTGDFQKSTQKLPTGFWELWNKTSKVFNLQLNCHKMCFIETKTERKKLFT